MPMRQLFICALLLSASAWGEENYWYLCEKDQQAARVIRVIYGKAPAPVPCEVSYIKSKGEEKQNLWSA
jgi:hypothetical protein